MFVLLYDTKIQILFQPTKERPIFLLRLYQHVKERFALQESDGEQVGGKAILPCHCYGVAVSSFATPPLMSCSSHLVTLTLLMVTAFLPTVRLKV